MYLQDLLTEEQGVFRDTIRRFVNREIIPVREKLEEDYALVEAIHQKLVELGIQRNGIPVEYGGTGPASAMIKAILCEEIARGDAGLSLSAGSNMGGSVLKAAVAAGNRVVLDRFMPPFAGKKLHYGCLAMTDAAAGADTENPLLKGRGISTRAELVGDEWVINGTKSWPTHAGIASVYLTVCTTAPELGDEGIALIYVPGDAPGLSFGRPERKMGFRTSINASIFYDDVRVPKDYRLAGAGQDSQFYHGIISGGQWHSALISLGIAQAAFDIALEYTGERKSNGRPVREWSMGAGILADMAVWLEMMRGAVYNYGWMLDNPDSYGPIFSREMSSKASIVRIFSADAAVWITNKAMELMGSNGLSPDFHLEKYLRDVKVLQLWLGGQQVSRYRVVRGYYDYERTT
ncbi:MAG: acyl-CoA dehydrogenase family protein [Deltaproteobacteria bacterium]|nr:acyl-CoA dehydrogenase family protein [Deltaproteobacteria bacterium]